MNILFVCTGNICRSPMAACYFRHICTERAIRNVTCASAGLATFGGAHMSKFAREALRQHGVPAPEHESQALSTLLMEKADLIVAMTADHVAELRARFPQAQTKVRTLLSFIGSNADVWDPFGGSLEEYTTCLATMQVALDELLRAIDSRPQSDWMPGPAHDTQDA